MPYSEQIRRGLRLLLQSRGVALKNAAPRRAGTRRKAQTRQPLISANEAHDGRPEPVESHRPCLPGLQAAGRRIEHEMRRGFTFLCRACNDRWVAQAPGTPKH